MNDTITQALPSGTEVTFNEREVVLTNWPTESTLQVERDGGEVEVTKLDDPNEELPVLLELGSKKWRTQVTNIVTDAIADGWLVRLVQDTGSLWRGQHFCISLFAPAHHVISVIEAVVAHDADIPKDVRRIGMTFCWRSDGDDYDRMLWQRDEVHERLVDVRTRDGELPHVSTNRYQVGDWKGYDREAGWRTETKPLVSRSAPTNAAMRLSEKLQSLETYANEAAAYDPDTEQRTAIRRALEAVVSSVQSQRADIAKRAKREVERATDRHRLGGSSVDDELAKMAPLNARERLVEQVFKYEGTTYNEDDRKIFCTLEHAALRVVDDNLASYRSEEQVVFIIAALKKAGLTLSFS